MGEIAALISATGAVIAFIFAIVVHFQTRNLMRRMERPTISLVKTDIGSSYIGKLRVSFEFKNIGKSSATKLNVHMYGCLKQVALIVKKIDTVHIVNQKEPGMSFPWEVEVRYAPQEAKDFLFCIEVTYRDIVTAKNYHNELWLRYRRGESNLKDMDIKDYYNMKREMPKIRGNRLRKQLRRKISEVLTGEKYRESSRG